MARPVELEDLYALRIASDPQMSPDGSRVAFVVTRADRESDEDHSSIWMVDTGGGEPRGFTSGTADLSPRWSPDGRNLAFLSTRGGEKAKPQLYLIPADGGETRALTDLPLGAGEPVWSPDGEHLAFTALVDLDEGREKGPIVDGRLDHKADGAGLLKGHRTHLFTVPAGGGEPRQLTAGDFNVSLSVWSPDGEHLAFSSSMAEDRDLEPAQAVHLIPSSGGEPERLTPKDGAYLVTDWSPDGETLLLVGQERVQVGHNKLFTVSAGGGDPAELTPGYDRNVMVGAPAYPGAPPRYTDGRVVFCARDRGRVHVMSVAASGGEPEVVAGGDQVVAGVSTAGQRIAFVAATNDSPGEIFILDDDGDRAVTDLFRGDLPDVQLPERTERTFSAPDGTEIEGWILRGADASGSAPLLLDVHGGPHNAWGPVFDQVHLYHYTLVARGWTILCINPRGSDGYGERFWSGLQADGWGRADEGDFLAAIDALVDEGLADPDRLAVGGYSYGGYMACWLTARTDRFAAAVAGGTVSNLLSFTGTSAEGWPVAFIELGISPYTEQAALAELSPITHAASVRTPTLVIHAQEDQTCPIGQAEEWFTALRSQRIPSELVRYQGTGHLHILSGPPSQRIDYCKRFEEWLTRYAEEPTVAPLGAPPRQRVRGLQARLEELTRRHGVPAASVALLADGEIVEAATGVLNVETGVEATTDSIFQMGSIGKTWTATAVMQLVDQGLIDLDAPIVSLLPEFRVADPEVTRQVTMRHLLSHTSGIDGDHFPETGPGDDAIERYVESCAELGQSHPLGATMSYCNAGYVIAGRIIEVLTGKVWDQAMKELLFDPLGLSHTVTLPEEALRYRAAFGHVVEPGEEPKLAPVWRLTRGSGPAGGNICTTPTEMLTFAQMHFEDGRAGDGRQILAPGSVKAMQEAQVTVPDPYTLGRHWGLGWILFDWDDRRIIGHDGNTIGQSSFLRLVPDRGVAIALLTNGGNAQDLFRELFGELLEDFTGIQMPAPPEPLDEPGPLDASRYTGTYERASARIEVEERDGRLIATTTVLGPLAKLVPKPTEEHELLRAGPDLFVTREEGTLTWRPAVFFDLPDGTRAIHFGARATPRKETRADG